MGIETATNLMTLNVNWPLDGDWMNEGDDHMRMLKRVLQGIFPIGAIYTTKAQAIDPNEFIGGTWVLLPEERFMRQANSGQGGGETGGGDTVLAWSNIPAHTHDSGSLYTHSAGSHAHSFQGQIFGGSGNDVGTNFTANAGPGNKDNNATASAGAHQHTIDGNTGQTGNGTGFDPVPRYIAVYHWERTA